MFRSGSMMLRLPEAMRLAFLISGGLFVGVSLFQMANSGGPQMLLGVLLGVLFGCIRNGSQCYYVVQHIARWERQNGGKFCSDTSQSRGGSESATCL